MAAVAGQGGCGGGGDDDDFVRRPPPDALSSPLIEDADEDDDEDEVGVGVLAALLGHEKPQQQGVKRQPRPRLQKGDQGVAFNCPDPDCSSTPPASSPTDAPCFLLFPSHHSRDASWTALSCAEAYSKYSSLRSHVKTHHPLMSPGGGPKKARGRYKRKVGSNQLSAGPFAGRKKMHTCTFPGCDFTSSYKSSITNHTRVAHPAAIIDDDDEGLYDNV